MSFAMQTPLRLSIFGCVLKPWAAEGLFQNRKFGLFFILVDELSFGTKVFMIVKMLSKKKWKQKLGTWYSHRWH